MQLRVKRVELCDRTLLHTHSEREREREEVSLRAGRTKEKNESKMKKARFSCSQRKRLHPHCRCFRYLSAISHATASSVPARSGPPRWACQWKFFLIHHTQIQINQNIFYAWEYTNRQVLISIVFHSDFCNLVFAVKGPIKPPWNSCHVVEGFWDPVGSSARWDCIVNPQYWWRYSSSFDKIGEIFCRIKKLIYF